MDPLQALAKFVLGLIHQGKMEKWYRLAATCLVAGPIGFFGAFGLTVTNMLATGHAPLLSLVWGFGAGCTMFATVVLSSALHSGLWKDMTITLPPALQEALLQNDVTNLKSPNDTEVRKVLE